MKKILFLTIFIFFVLTNAFGKEEQSRIHDICKDICNNIEFAKQQVKNLKQDKKEDYEVYEMLAFSQACKCKELSKIYADASIKLDEESATYALVALFGKKIRGEHFHTLDDVDVQTAKILLNNGANSCFEFFGGYWGTDKYTPFDIFIYNFHFTGQKMDQELAKMMVQNCEKKELINGLLFSASGSHQTQLVKLLLDAGANPNHTEKYTVIKQKEVETVLMAAFDPEQIASGGFAPLTSYIPFPDKEMIEMLINKGAKVNTIGRRNEHDATALDFAINLYSHNLRGLSEINLKDHNTEERKKIEEAIASLPKGIDLIKLLVKNGAKTKDLHLFTAISAVGQYQYNTLQTVSDPVLVKFLLENGINTDIRDGDKDDTPLHVASKFCSLSAVKLLIENGAKVNIDNKEGMTPLDMCKIPYSTPYTSQEEYTKKETFMKERCKEVESFLKEHLNGPVREYYGPLKESKQLKSEKNYKNGKLHGLSKLYDKKGNVIVEQTYKDGKKNGITKNYRSDTTVEIMYKDDNAVFVKMYDKNGHLIDPSLHGKMLEQEADKKLKAKRHK